MSETTKVEKLLALQRRIDNLKIQRGSPVEALRYPNGASVTFRTMDDIDRALKNAEAELVKMESGTKRRARRVSIRML